MAFPNIQNEGFSTVPALNAWLIQSLLFRLHPIGRNRSRLEVPGRKMQDFKQEAEVGGISAKLSKQRPEGQNIEELFQEQKRGVRGRVEISGENTTRP